MAEHVTLPEAIERGMAHHRAGRLAEAEGIYREILAQAPDEPEVLHLLGYMAYQVGKHDAAIELISRAIAILPTQAKYYDNLGNALRAMGRPGDAVNVQLKGVELDPNDFEMRSNLAVAYLTCRNFEESQKHFRKVLDDHPDQAEVWNNYGGVLRELRRMNDAIAAFQRAIALKPELPEAHNNLAIALSSQGRQEEAVAEYRKSIELKPSHFSGHSNLLLSMHYLPECPAEEIFEESKKWAAMHAPNVGCASAHHSLSSDRKLRIGYISTDFFGHVVSLFFEPLLREHNHDKFEIYCYADLANPDGTSHRLMGLANEHRVITGMRSEDVANGIRQDEIDILVELGGHTSPHLLKIMALKPAPIQATYLGYPDTTGLPTVDYRITDSVADPVGWTDQYHTEKLLRLPRCAWCFRPQQQAWEVDVTAADESQPITFASFNTLSKVTPSAIELWANVLKAVPGSRLMLKASALGEDQTRDRLIAAFGKFGIEASRLELLAWTKYYADHLALYKKVNIALDSYPYNGTTTTCEAMWMGVPVIHLAGKTHVSRVGASLLTAVGLADLSAISREGYIENAVRLAADKKRLKEIRSTLRETMKRSELMNEKDLAQAIEGAYRAMWEAACQKP